MGIATLDRCLCLVIKNLESETTDQYSYLSILFVFEVTTELWYETFAKL